MAVAMADVDMLLPHMVVDMATVGMETTDTDMDMVLEVAPMVLTLAMDTVITLVDVVLLDVDVELMRLLACAMMAMHLVPIALLAVVLLM